MADFRTVQTRIWRGDEWFQTLPTDGRLLWLYLFTNESANACGLYRITLKTISNETGLSQARGAELLADFQAVGKAHFANGLLFVVNMQKLQHGEIGWQLATRINTELAGLPDGELKQLYRQRYGCYTVTWAKDERGKNLATLLHKPFTPPPLPPVPVVLPAAPAPPDPAPAPPTPPTKPRIAAHLPAQVQTYLAAGGEFPKGKLGDDSKMERCIAFISEHVGADEASLDLWGRVVRGYCAIWANTSYTIMVNNYYALGKVPGEAGKNGNAKGGGFGLQATTGLRDRQYQAQQTDAVLAAAQAEFDNAAAGQLSTVQGDRLAPV